MLCVSVMLCAYSINFGMLYNGAVPQASLKSIPGIMCTVHSWYFNVATKSCLCTQFCMYKHAKLVKPVWSDGKYIVCVTVMHVFALCLCFKCILA